MKLRARGSAAGNIITLVLLLGIVALGLWLWLGKKTEDAPKAGTPTAQGNAPANGVAKPDGDAPEPIEPVTGTPTLEAVNTYVPKDNTLRIDISAVSYTHLRAHETPEHLVCRLL